ncbi:MAG: phosphoribosylglycinamide formyltransferase [Candidatus Wallbacteria bacterium]|nr:phosphoribosylglycinamide formyltransferase [Candidatus Wallbacteria bacterium]
MLSLGVLASGRGSNFLSILDQIDEGSLKCKVKVLISDKCDANALVIAREHGISSIFIDPGRFQKRAGFEAAVVEKLREFQVELVILAGFMRIAGKTLLSAFPDKIVNIHPSLLPSFPGLLAQRQALEYGVKISGCTVHFVNSGVDSGPIILQKAVPVLEGDTQESLSERILAEEHKLFPEALSLLAEKRVKIRGRVVSIIPGRTS